VIEDTVSNKLKIVHVDYRNRKNLILNLLRISKETINDDTLFVAYVVLYVGL